MCLHFLLVFQSEFLETTRKTSSKNIAKKWMKLLRLEETNRKPK